MNKEAKINGDEFTKIMVQLEHLSTAYEGLREVLTEKFKPIDTHLKDSFSFRDKVVKNTTAIFFLRLILVPILLAITFAVWRVLK